MKVLEHTFQCPLPNGLHARPASQFADVAGRFASEIVLTSARTGAVANAKSILSLVAVDVKLDDACELRIVGEDADAARAALADFIANVLPGCDEPLPVVALGREVALPRGLRQTGVPWFGGTVVCPGIGWGNVVPVGGLMLPPELAGEPAGAPEFERELVFRALAAVRAGLESKLVARPTGVEAGILRAHLSIASDVSLGEKLDELVAGGCSAGRAITHAAEFFANRLRAADSAYVHERAIDVEDIGLQLLEQVYGKRIQTPGIVLTQPAVVVAENLTPRQLLAADRRFLRALLLEHAGATSHAVILARSFNIPTLTGITELRAKLPAGSEVVVDANVGIVLPEVSAPVRRYYEREQRKLSRRQERLAAYVHAPGTTRDGQRLEVAANVATAAELAPVFEQGADGIGLFRTEMLFMDREAPPSEEEQFGVYAQAARAAGGRPVIIRTLDVGGDKPVPYLHLPEEANPFLGYRGVRIYPEYRELLVAQLRAIARASAFGPVWVMAPMISTPDEARWLKAQVTEVQVELRGAGVAHDPAMRVGIMLEVPAAAFCIDRLAAEIDFFSIGTNDLTQYFMAVDRDGDKVANLYSSRHPAFLRLLAMIVAEVHRCGRWVGMCGEMTRSPRNLALLVGLGLDEISTAGPEIPAVKAALARLAADECRALLQRALDCRDVAEVEALVADFGGRGVSADLLDPEFIAIDSDSATKEEAIKEIIDAFHVAGRAEQPEAVEDAVWAREGVYSTGLGHGFAIPHCKTDAIAANSIGFVRLRQPIAWEAVDGQPVQCVILLAMRESDRDGAHMKVFSKLARRLMHEDFRQRLLDAADASAVLQYLREELEISAERGG